MWCVQFVKWPKKKGVRFFKTEAEARAAYKALWKEVDVLEQSVTDIGGKRPKNKYQCVSHPGECKFEWCCGPLCACVVRGRAKTAQERRDTKIARNRQYRLAIKRGQRKPRRRVTIEGRRAEAALREDARRRGY